MRDRFQIVHMRDDGSYDVLARSIPKKRRDRWAATEQFAHILLKGELVKSLEAGPEYGLTYAYTSIDHPYAGYVGIIEKD